MHNFAPTAPTQQRKCNFPKRILRESKDLFTVKRVSDVTAVHENPEFITQMIVERGEQTSSTAPSIHVNPKFLKLNWQNRGNVCDTKHVSSVNKKSCFCLISQECVCDKLLGQNKCVGWQPCPSEKSLNLHCSSSSQSESSACIGGATSSGAAVKIAVGSGKNADTKSHANQNVNVTHKNLNSRSVYINPNFTQTSHLSAVDSRMCRNGYLQGNQNTNSCAPNKTSRSVFVNPKFSNLEIQQPPQMVGKCKILGKHLISPGVELVNNTDKHVYVNPKFSHLKMLQSSQMVGNCKIMAKHFVPPNLKLVNKADKHVYVNPKFSNLETLQLPQTFGERKMVGKHLVSLHVKLNKADKHVYVNPQYVAPKHHCNLEQNVSRVSTLIPNSLKWSGLPSCNKGLQLLDLKPDMNSTASTLIDRGTNSSVSDIYKKVVAENSKVLCTPNTADKRSASNKVLSKSQILLSKTKSTHSSVKCAVKRTREEQQNAFVSIGNKKLVRRRSLTLPRKVLKICEQSSILKVSSGRLALQPTMGLRSFRTKYKIVKNSPVCDVALSAETASRPSSSSLKLARCSLAANSSSSVASSRSTENLSALCRKTAHHNSLVLLSKTKLIRSNVKFAGKESIAGTQTVTISNNARKLVRQRSSARSARRTSVAKFGQRKVALPPIVRMARSVRTKYKYVRSLSMQKDRRMGCEVPRHCSRARQCLKSTYRIDRRVQCSPRAARRLRKYRANYEGLQWHSQARPHARSMPSRASAPTSRAWKSASYLQFSRVAEARRRLQRTSSRLSSGMALHRAGGSNMLNIGGILYRRSANQLMRTSANTQAAATSVTGALHRGVHVLHVRGATFLMEPSGRTMRRIHTTTARPPVTRIDIGGVTFLQKSHNVLIRTDCHKTRSFVSQAKQRSIATLTQKMKKNNQPCLFYQRFGKCLRQQKGTCPRLHDPKQIAVCKNHNCRVEQGEVLYIVLAAGCVCRFLRGCCENAGCTLSHDVVPQKMATCRFFLEGVCMRDNCPYLHVKLSSKAAICIGFLRGYCALADKCEKRHVNVCPDWERRGECVRGKSCPYPHKVGARPQARARKREPAQKREPVRKCEPPQASTEQPAVARRYYQELGTRRLHEAAEPPVALKRSRLEPGPGYIALTQSLHGQK